MFLHEHNSPSICRLIITTDSASMVFISWLIETNSMPNFQNSISMSQILKKTSRNYKLPNFIVQHHFQAKVLLVNDYEIVPEKYGKLIVTPPSKYFPVQSQL